MSYEHPHCEYCRDTGRTLVDLATGEHSDHLDCGRCGAAQERTALEVWAKNLVDINRLPLADSSLMWAIHERARDQSYAEIVRLSKERSQAEARIVSGTATFHRLAQAKHAALVAENGDAGEIAKLSTYLGLAPHVDAQAERIAELEAQIAAASVPAVEQQPEWMDFDIEKTGDDHFDAGNFLLNAAQEFWNACRRAQQYGAVQWLTGENGELLIYTRGEYRERLMLNIEAMGPTKHFKAPQLADTDKLREAILNTEIVTTGSKGYAKAFFTGAREMREACAEVVSATALQAPVREVPETWISVEDRYPELTVRNENKVVINGRTIPPTTSSERVLVALDSGARQIDMATRLDGSEHTFFQCYGKRVKYWSPLPASPVQPNTDKEQA